MRGVAPKKPLSNFPYLASCKIDGLRALVKDGVVYSKTMKPIPNQHVQRLFSRLHGADGELTVGPAHKCGPDDDVFDRSRGPIMSRDQEADFRFHIFDCWDQPTMSAWARARRVTWHYGMGVKHPDLVWSRLVHNQNDLDEVVEECLADGYEGAMLRQVNAPYKYGTSTEKEGFLLKIKPMDEAEAMILGVVEQMENTNEATIDELGYTKRSAAKAGKIGKGTFGAFLVRDLKTGAEFSVGMGPGLTDAKREILWAQRASLPGLYIQYRYQACGTKDAPRLPAFLRFRDAIDISEVWE